MTTVTVIYQSIIKPGPAGLQQPNLKHLFLGLDKAYKRTKHKILVSVIVVPSIRVLFHGNPIDSKVEKKNTLVIRPTWVTGNIKTSCCLVNLEVVTWSTEKICSDRHICGLITFHQISNLIQPFLCDIRHYPSPIIRVTNALVFQTVSRINIYLDVMTLVIGQILLAVPFQQSSPKDMNETTDLSIQKKIVISLIKYF